MVLAFSGDTGILNLIIAVLLVMVKKQALLTVLTPNEQSKCAKANRMSNSIDMGESFQDYS